MGTISSGVDLLLYSLGFYADPSFDFTIPLSIVMNATFTVLFISKLRYKIRDIVTVTPRWAMIYASVIFALLQLINLILLIEYLFVGTDGSNYYAYLNAFLDMEQVGSADLANWGAIAIATGLFAKLFILLVEGLLLASFLVFMIVSNRKHLLQLENQNFGEQITAQAEHYRNLAEANAEMRRFKHDFKNVRFAIEQFLADGRKQEALDAMHEFDQVLSSNSRQMILFDTGNGIADALLTDKVHRAHSKHTVLRFRGAIPQGGLAPTDLCVLLGNSIDNAIEACEKLPPNFYREISVECQCSSGFLFLTVRNPIDKPVTIFDHWLPSSKQDKALHGFGISSMHKVAGKYDGTVKLDANDGFFTVNIELCIPAANATLAG